jgi:hypothetical protein
MKSNWYSYKTSNNAALILPQAIRRTPVSQLHLGNRGLLLAYVLKVVIFILHLKQISAARNDDTPSVRSSACRAIGVVMGFPHVAGR